MRGVIVIVVVFLLIFLIKLNQKVLAKGMEAVKINKVKSKGTKKGIVSIEKHKKQQNSTPISIYQPKNNVFNSKKLGGIGFDYNKKYSF